MTVSPIEISPDRAEDLLRNKLQRIAPYIPHEFMVSADRQTAHNKIRTLRGAVIFVDLAGFSSLVSSLAAKGPAGIEKMQRLLKDYYTELIDSIHSFGGSVYQFAGDSVLAGFTVPEDEPE